MPNLFVDFLLGVLFFPEDEGEYSLELSRRHSPEGHLTFQMLGDYLEYLLQTFLPARHRQFGYRSLVVDVYVSGTLLS
jgi:hypothetical protein